MYMLLFYQISAWVFLIHMSLYTGFYCIRSLRSTINLVVEKICYHTEQLYPCLLWRKSVSKQLLFCKDISSFTTALSLNWIETHFYPEFIALSTKVYRITLTITYYLIIMTFSSYLVSVPGITQFNFNERWKIFTSPWSLTLFPRSSVSHRRCPSTPKEQRH